MYTNDPLGQGTSRIDGAGAATATATNRETRSTLESMAMKIEGK